MELFMDGNHYRVLSVKTLSDGKKTRMATAQKRNIKGVWREVVNYSRLMQLAAEYDKRQDIPKLDRRVTETREALIVAGFSCDDLNWLANCSEWHAMHEAEMAGVPAELVRLYRQSLDDLCAAIFAQSSPGVTV